MPDTPDIRPSDIIRERLAEEAADSDPLPTFTFTWPESINKAIKLQAAFTAKACQELADRETPYGDDTWDAYSGAIRLLGDLLDWEMAGPEHGLRAFAEGMANLCCGYEYSCDAYPEELIEFAQAGFPETTDEDWSF